MNVTFFYSFKTHSTFLGGCVHESLIEGELEMRFGSKANKLLLLEFLTSEVQAVRLISHSTPALNVTAQQVTFFTSLNRNI